MLKILNETSTEEGVEILHSFFQESPYKDETFSETKVRNLWVKASQSDDYLLLGYYKDDILVGILVGMKTDLMFTDEPICSELVWYVYPEYRKGYVGIRLLRAFEYWAKNVVQVKKICMAHLGNEDLSRIYKKMGFTKYEESFLKGI